MTTVKEVMEDQVAKVPQTANVLDAARKMAEEGVSAVVVVDKSEKLVGLVTDGRLATGVLATGKDPQRTSIQDVMISAPITATEDVEVCEVMEWMAGNSTWQVPVIDEERRIVGVMSASDVAKEHAINCRDCSATILEITSTRS